MYIDSHCHLFYEDFADDLPDVIERARRAGVEYFIVPATNHETARRAVELADRYPSIFAAVGFHPLDANEYSDERLRIIEELSSHPKVVAIGEIGMDFFYDTTPRDVQAAVFSRQLELAVTTNLPIIVHTRDSVEETIRMVLDHCARHREWCAGKYRGVFHCFTGTAEQAGRLMQERVMVSFPGPITFKKSEMPDVVAQIGLDNVLIETDAPFLAPVPHRGKRNEPGYVPLIAQKISECTGLPLETVAEKTSHNAIRLFQLPV